MLKLTASVLLVLLMISHAVAGSGKAGAFDYYVLSLSWSPSYCALEGQARGASACDSGRALGFSLHGLWPQYEKGWPSFCPSSWPAPAAETLADMGDIMGSSGLARHEWDKHGRCSGLSAASYFDLARKAYGKIERPAVFRRLLKPVMLSPKTVKAAFLDQNQWLGADTLTVTCNRDHFQEVRICLNKDLTARRCGVDVLKDCRQKVLFPPLR